MRLVPGEALDKALPCLHHLLAQQLLARPPYDLRWLRPRGEEHPLQARHGGGALGGHAHPGCPHVPPPHTHLAAVRLGAACAPYVGLKPLPALQATLLHCITDASVAAVDDGEARGCLTAEQWGSLEEHQQEALLALRGLLACGLLQHALQKRHRVDYGVFRSVGGGWLGRQVGDMCRGGWVGTGQWRWKWVAGCGAGALFCSTLTFIQGPAALGGAHKEFHNTKFRPSVNLCGPQLKFFDPRYFFGP